MTEARTGEVTDPSGIEEEASCKERSQTKKQDYHNEALNERHGNACLCGGGNCYPRHQNSSCTNSLRNEEQEHNALDSHCLHSLHGQHGCSRSAPALRLTWHCASQPLQLPKLICSPQKRCSRLPCAQSHNAAAVTSAHAMGLWIHG